MMSDAVWALVLGAALTLIATLVAQWSSLVFQTKREAATRRADFQRSTLLQIRERLVELPPCTEEVFWARQEALERAGGWDLLGHHHPNMEAVSSVALRLLALAAAVEDERLRLEVVTLAQHELEAAQAPTEKGADERREKGIRAYGKVVNLLGEELRKLR